MKISYFQVNAFTNSVFGGNPAGVCLLETWLSDHVLQQIAAENRLSETAFLVGQHDRYELRWFTPDVEIDLCGHATLACSHVILMHLNSNLESICFQTRVGELKAYKRNDLIWMDFPARPGKLIETPEVLIEALKATPAWTYRSNRDIMAVFDAQEQIEALDPDMERLKILDCVGVIVTAPGKDADFVSRFFAPSVGISEDPVTGSSHCTLVPYWSCRLNKNELCARQLSKRGGTIYCKYDGKKVPIGGKAITYLIGSILLTEY